MEKEANFESSSGESVDMFELRRTEEAAVGGKTEEDITDDAGHQHVLV